MMKLWKGLFYTFWMSDKPLVQEELAIVLSEMVRLKSGLKPSCLSSAQRSSRGCISLTFGRR